MIFYLFNEDNNQSKNILEFLFINALYSMIKYITLDMKFSCVDTQRCVNIPFLYDIRRSHHYIERVEEQLLFLAFSHCLIVNLVKRISMFFLRMNSSYF